MANTLRSLTFAALLATLGSSVHAAYAQLQPPPGWTAGTATAPANYGKAANEAWGASTVRTNAALNVGGRAIQVPAAMRLSANAGQVLSGRIGVALLSGGATVIAGTALTAAAFLALPAAIAWYSQQDTYKWDPTKNQFVRDVSIESCQPLTPTEQAYCQSFVSRGLSVGIEISPGPNGACYHIARRPADGGYFDTCATKGKTTLSQDQPAPWPEPAPALNPLPIGDPLLNDPAITFPWPVEQPVLNPTPGPNPQPQPLFVPTGDPVPNPNYDPQQAPSPTNQPFIQPGVRVVPSPTLTEPWRVDVQPVNRPVETSNPIPDPVTETEPNTGDKPKDPEPADLCKDHPDIVACQKLGGPPEAKDVPNEDRNMTITKDNGWGQENGTCPAPRTVQVSGLSLAMPFDLLCDFANGIRPVIVGLAWLSAAFAFLGIGRRE